MKSANRANSPTRIFATYEGKLFYRLLFYNQTPGRVFQEAETKLKWLTLVIFFQSSEYINLNLRSSS